MLTASDGFLVMDTGTGAVTPLAPVEADKPATRMNDGACDRAGRFWAGTMAADESAGQGALYRLDPDLQLTQLRTGVGISNGIGWSPDETRMYYVDSLAYQIEAMEYDPATGQTGRSRVLASLGHGGVMPDGLTVDADGYVWVAVWGGGARAVLPARRPAVPDGEGSRGQRHELRVRRPGPGRAVHHHRGGPRCGAGRTVLLPARRHRPALPPVPRLTCAPYGGGGLTRRTAARHDRLGSGPASRCGAC